MNTSLVSRDGHTDVGIMRESCGLWAYSGICECASKSHANVNIYKKLHFWVKNESAWLCLQFWVPKISWLFIPFDFIHPQEWKLRVQNHKILVKKRWFFFTIDAVYAHWCASDAHRCASAKIGAWPSLVETLFGRMPFEHAFSLHGSSLNLSTFLNFLGFRVLRFVRIYNTFIISFIIHLDNC